MKKKNKISKGMAIALGCGVVAIVAVLLFAFSQEAYAMTKVFF